MEKRSLPVEAGRLEDTMLRTHFNLTGNEKFGYGAYRKWPLKHVPYKALLWAYFNVPNLDPRVKAYIGNLRERKRIFNYLAQ